MSESGIGTIDDLSHRVWLVSVEYLKPSPGSIEPMFFDQSSRYSLMSTKSTNVADCIRRYCGKKARQI